jgi:hypothetical protein
LYQASTHKTIDEKERKNHMKKTGIFVALLAMLMVGSATSAMAYTRAEPLPVEANYSSEIVIDGKSYPHLEPAQALNLGVAVVYQEMIQMEAMTVMDNIFMGMDESKGIFVDDRADNVAAAEAVGSAVESLRCCASISADWAAPVEADTASRR